MWSTVNYQQEICDTPNSSQIISKVLPSLRATYSFSLLKSQWWSIGIICTFHVYHLNTIFSCSLHNPNINLDNSYASVIRCSATVSIVAPCTRKLSIFVIQKLCMYSKLSLWKNMCYMDYLLNWIPFVE